MDQTYNQLVYTRDEEVDGIGPWTWIQSDHGAWDGPKNDWESSHKFKYFEKVKEFNVVVQAGGNQGMYPRLLADKFKVVYTFEPDPLNFYCLVQNCQLDNIIKMQAALGDSRKPIHVHRSTMSNTGMHQVRPQGTVPQIRLDDIEFEDLNCLLLDVESYEIGVLRGAVETIKKFKPVIALENGTTPDIELFMKDIGGYRQQTLSMNDTIWYYEEQNQ